MQSRVAGGIIPPAVRRCTVPAPGCAYCDLPPKRHAGHKPIHQQHHQRNYRDPNQRASHRNYLLLQKTMAWPRPQPKLKKKKFEQKIAKISEDRLLSPLRSSRPSVPKNPSRFAGKSTRAAQWKGKTDFVCSLFRPSLHAVCCSCSPSSAIMASRILNFWILPVTVCGNCSTSFT